MVKSKDLNPDLNTRKHKKSRSKDDSQKPKKSHKKHHHHHHHRNKDSKKNKDINKQEKQDDNKEQQKGQFTIQQALIQAQQSQNQQFMNVNFFELANQEFQINDINYIVPELQFQYRHARRLYVGNLPDGVETEEVVDFLWRTMQAAGGLLDTSNPIIRTDPFLTQKYIFIELRSIEETDACLQLDGLIFAGKALRFRRPKDFDKYPTVKGSRAVPQLNLSALGLCAIPTFVNESPNKLFIGGIPLDFDEGQVIQLLQLKEFGSLKGFHLVKDSKTNNSKGYAFLEYQETEGASRCIQRLDGLQIMGRNLQCKRAENSNEHKFPKHDVQINYPDMMQFQNQPFSRQQVVNQQYTNPQFANQQYTNQYSVMPQTQMNELSNMNYQNQPYPRQQQEQYGLNANFVI